jgi:hypothetical protein
MCARTHFFLLLTANKNILFLMRIYRIHTLISNNINILLPFFFLLIFIICSANNELFLFFFFFLNSPLIVCLSLAFVQQHQSMRDLEIFFLLFKYICLCVFVYLWWLLFRMFQVSVLHFSFFVYLIHALVSSLISIFIISDIVL